MATCRLLFESSKSTGDSSRKDLSLQLGVQTVRNLAKLLETHT